MQKPLAAQFSKKDSHFLETKMPNYEYRCLDCHRRFDIFMSYSEYGSQEILCTHCQSANIQRRIGRVRVARSTESRIENMADPSSLEDMERDPRALGRMMRQLSSETGEDMGDTFNEVVNRLESGQDPEAIERDIPNLGEELGGGLEDGGGMGLGGMGGGFGMDD